MADPDAFNKRMHLLWLGIGTAEPQRMYDSVHGYHEALEQGGHQDTSSTSRPAPRTSG